MALKDYRGYEISGATPAARDAFEAALASFQGWRTGAEDSLSLALREAPKFTMAYVLKAYLCLGSRDIAVVRRARWAHARASALAANARERIHLAAIAAALADDLVTYRALLEGLLLQYPLDVLALQVGHALDYLTGDVERLGERVPSVLSAWSASVPGYSVVLAMQAFGLVESAQYQSATETAMRALELDPYNARAHHVVTHVHEMTGNPDGGARWMRDRIAFWAVDTTAATHLWWHWALFHLARNDVTAALALHDKQIWKSASAEVSDMIDATSLLWRIELLGTDTGARWKELAVAWAPHIADGYCTFSDLHAMLSFVGAQDWPHASRLQEEFTRRRDLSTRHGETTRLVGEPAGRALMAFGRGEFNRTVELLSALPEVAHRIGGSHAQRDVLYLTLLAAIQRVRRPPLHIAA
jgi:hypothetical protein